MIDTVYMIMNLTTKTQIGNAHACPYIEKEKAIRKMEKLKKENPDCDYILQQFNLDYSYFSIDAIGAFIKKEFNKYE